VKRIGPAVWLGLIVAAGVLLGPSLAANGDDFRVMWLTGLGVLTLLAGAAALGGARIPWRMIWTDFAIEVLLSRDLACARLSPFGSKMVFRRLMRSWSRTSSQRVVAANAGTHHPWPQK